MMTRLGRIVGPSPEESGMAVVFLSQTHARRVQRRNHARIDAVDARRIGTHYRHVRNTTAFLATMECQRTVTPQVRVRRFLTSNYLHIGGVGISPDRTVASTNRAVAIEHPFRQLGDFESNGGAMHDGSAHPFILASGSGILRVRACATATPQKYSRARCYLSRSAQY